MTNAEIKAVLVEMNDVLRALAKMTLDLQPDRDLALSKKQRDQVIKALAALDAKLKGPRP
jgi:hypothetical protein